MTASTTKINESKKQALKGLAEAREKLESDEEKHFFLNQEKKETCGKFQFRLYVRKNNWKKSEQIRKC